MRKFLLPIIIATAISGCGRAGDSASAADSSSVKERNETSDSGDSTTAAESDITQTAMEMADSVLRNMTLEQRVGQLFMPAIYTSDDAYTMRLLHSYINDMHVGGVVLLKGNLNSAAAMSAAGASADVPLFISIDAEWGLGMRLKDAPDFPRNGRISKQADEELLYDYGREVARECRRVGINMVLGPVIDVVENPKGVIGSRSFGGDPERVANLGVAYARGLESGGVVSVAKHFPGHGSPRGDSHRELPMISRSLHTLDSIDLHPFRSYVDAGLSGVMVGHLAVPAIDPQRRPAAVSEIVINELLRGELGFSGLVLTDALNMGGVDGYGAAAAIAAGADIVVAPKDTQSEIADVLSKLKTNSSGNQKLGEINEAVINDRCRRILFRKILLGLWSRPAIPLDSLREDVAAHTDTLRLRLSR